MIQKLLEEAPPRDAVMYLVNALSFDGEWRDIYKKNQIHKGTFNAETGNTSPRSSCIPQKQSILKIHWGGDS